MTQRSAAATEVARGLWQRAVGDSTTPEDVAAAATRMCTELRAGLSRWVGAMGYRALIDRALLLARAEHPALGSLSCHGGDQPLTTAAVRAHSAAEVTAGIVALVVTLIDLLSRVVGEEMAVQLVNQAMAASPRRALEHLDRSRQGLHPEPLTPTHCHSNESSQKDDRKPGVKSRDQLTPHAVSRVTGRPRGMANVRVGKLLSSEF